MSSDQAPPDGRIFISYRRQDAAYPAGWLFDRLSERFAEGQLFKDVDSIEVGDDFVEVITDAVASCDILLAVIGPDWATIAGPDGEPRLHDPQDFVRLEIEAALDRDVMLIPILVEGAAMPPASQLPPSVAPVVRRQALELSPHRFKADSAHLMQVIERTLRELTNDTEPPPTALVNEPIKVPAKVPAKSRAASVDSLPLMADRSGRPERDTLWSNVRTRWLLSVLSAMAIIAMAVVLWPRSEPATPKLGSFAGPIVLAEGGAADDTVPSHTVEAFTAAARLGAVPHDDVLWTKDNVPIIMPFAETGNEVDCGGESYAVAHVAWRTLRDDCRWSAPAGQTGPVASLESVMKALQPIPGAEFYANVIVPCSPAQAASMAHAITSSKMTRRIAVASWAVEVPKQIRAAIRDPSMRMIVIATDDSPSAHDLAASGVWAVEVPLKGLTSRYVREVNAAGVKVGVWTVNDIDGWLRAADRGADLVVTGVPQEYGRWASTYYAD